MKSVLSFHAQGLIQLGVSAADRDTHCAVWFFRSSLFALQRDRTYILVTLIVLGCFPTVFSGRAL